MTRQIQALAIHLLGVPHVERDGRALPAPRGRKAWGLLAYLLYSPAPVSRSHLAGLLFEEADDPLAALRWSLSELRRLLGRPDWLRGDELLPLPDSAIHVDVRVVMHGGWAQALSVPGLDHELLEGMVFASCPAFEVWLATERRHLQGVIEAVLREAALARMAAGALSEAADLAGRLVRRNPLDENYQALLVRSLAAAGDGVGAARQAAACRELFRRELGVQPGATLEAALRTSTAAPVAHASTGRGAALAQLEAGQAAIGAGALDAGLHCLRRAIAESDATSDAVLRARARLALGAALVHAARGRDEEGASALHEALAVGRDACAPIAAAACRELAYVEFLRGRHARALPWLQRAAALAGSDSAEQARIETVHGALLSDTAHYAAAIAMLQGAVLRGERASDMKLLAYALAMLGRAWLLRGELAPAAAVLERAVLLARQGWTAFVPWPQSLRAEIDLLRGNVDAAADSLEQAFALGCQLADPCWEGLAGRGLGCVARASGDWQRAAHILRDSVERCSQLPDAYLWVKGYALDALCSLAVAQAMPEASAWVDALYGLCARGGMRELTVRAHLHRAALGHKASAAAARLLARQIDNPALHALVPAQCGNEDAGPARRPAPSRRPAPGG